MVYVEPLALEHGQPWSRLRADSTDELHRFAVRHQLTAGYQPNPADPDGGVYLLTATDRDRAIRAGAAEATWLQVHERLRDITPPNPTPKRRGWTAGSATVVLLTVLAVAGACAKGGASTTATGTSRAGAAASPVTAIAGTVTTEASATTTAPATTIVKATDVEGSVSYPDGMDCPGTDKATIESGWGGTLPPLPAGNIGGMYAPGPIHVLDSSIVTAAGERFDVLAVGCGTWKDHATKGAYNLAEGWNRDVTLKLLVYHVTASGVRDRRTDTQDFTRGWVTCGFQNTKQPDVADVYCNQLASASSRVVVGSVAVTGDGAATVTATGTPAPTVASTAGAAR